MLLSLARTNDPILRKPTRPILSEEIKSFHNNIVTMFHIIDIAGGIGLSAPQVSIDRSLFVISIQGDRRVFINPQILSVSEKMSIEKEGCLSLPDLELKIKRPERVTATWVNEDNVPQIAELEALWARCWLHEYDHLQGIMMDDRVSKLALDIAHRKMLKHKRQKQQELK